MSSSIPHRRLALSKPKASTRSSANDEATSTATRSRRTANIDSFERAMVQDGLKAALGAGRNPGRLSAAESLAGSHHLPGTEPGTGSAGTSELYLHGPTRLGDLGGFGSASEETGARSPSLGSRPEPPTGSSGEAGLSDPRFDPTRALAGQEPLADPKAGRRDPMGSTEASGSGPGPEGDAASSPGFAGDPRVLDGGSSEADDGGSGTEEEDRAAEGRKKVTVRLVVGNLYRRLQQITFTDEDRPDDDDSINGGPGVRGKVAPGDPGLALIDWGGPSDPVVQQMLGGLAGPAEGGDGDLEERPTAIDPPQEAYTTAQAGEMRDPEEVFWDSQSPSILVGEGGAAPGESLPGGPISSPEDHFTDPPEDEPEAPAAIAE